MSEICRVDLVTAESLSAEQRTELGITATTGLVVLETRCTDPVTTGKLLTGGYAEYLTMLVQAALDAATQSPTSNG